MDPLPNINKAYYIVQQVEKQKQVTHHVAEPTAFFANTGSRGNQGPRRDNRDGRENRGDKKTCTYCKQDGHVYEQCFERLGYPDWYKGKKNRKGGRMAAQVTTDFDGYKQFFDSYQCLLCP